MKLLGALLCNNSSKIKHLRWESMIDERIYE